MKKLIALLLALMMLLTLAACGKEEPSLADIEKPEAAQQETETEAPVEEEPETEMTTHENTYFTVACDASVGWEVAEDDFYIYDTGGNAYVRVLDEEGDTELVVYINAEKEDADAFRKALYVNGFDQKAYVDGSLETVDVGGQPMLYVDNYGDRFFFGRNEAAGVYYTIEASDWEDPRVPALVENITCTASDTDNVDAPWPWEGTPFSGGSVSQMVGTHTLTADFLPMAEPLVTYETFNHDIEILSDKAYLISDGVLMEYAYDGAGLTFIREIPLEDEYELVESAGSDLVISGFMKPVLGYNGDSVIYSYEGPDKFSVAPDGTWGVSWFSSGDGCEKYTFSDGALTGSPLPFAEVQIISSLSVDENYIYVAGSAVETSDHTLFVYDHSGALQMTLGSDPTGTIGLGSITYVTKTANGYLALDGNMRDVVLWTPDGTWLGSVDTGDLFGADYPWLCAADKAADGSIVCIMTQDRADGSAMEAVAFKLSGF